MNVLLLVVPAAMLLSQFISGNVTSLVYKDEGAPSVHHLFFVHYVSFLPCGLPPRSTFLVLLHVSRREWHILCSRMNVKYTQCELSSVLHHAQCQYMYALVPESLDD